MSESLTNAFKQKVISTLQNRIHILLFAIICFWLSVWFSYRKIPSVPGGHDPYAEGGFPSVIFSYPVPPLGSGIPFLGGAEASHMDYMALTLNSVFWIGVAVLLFFVLPTKWTLHRNTKGLTVFFAVSLSILGFFYLLLKYD